MQKELYSSHPFRALQEELISFQDTLDGVTCPAVLQSPRLTLGSPIPYIRCLLVNSDE